MQAPRQGQRDQSTARHGPDGLGAMARSRRITGPIWGQSEHETGQYGRFCRKWVAMSGGTCIVPTTDGVTRGPRHWREQYNRSGNGPGRETRLGGMVGTGPGIATGQPRGLHEPRHRSPNRDHRHIADAGPRNYRGPHGPHATATANRRGSHPTFERVTGRHPDGSGATGATLDSRQDRDSGHDGPLSRGIGSDRTGTGWRTWRPSTAGMRC